MSDAAGKCPTLQIVLAEMKISVGDAVLHTLLFEQHPAFKLAGTANMKAVEKRAAIQSERRFERGHDWLRIVASRFPLVFGFRQRPVHLDKIDRIVAVRID